MRTRRTSRAGDPCTSAPARPYLYEGTFAHEYQHLLESYEDPDEVNWVNEGLSDWAQTLVGYVDPSHADHRHGFDATSSASWAGSRPDPANPIPRRRAGELADALGRPGRRRDPLRLRRGVLVHGVPPGPVRGRLHVRAAPTRTATASTACRTSSTQVAATPSWRRTDVLHDWADVALDGLIDDGAKLAGQAKEKDVTAPTMHATINWDTPDAYDARAPANGSDYVRLRDAERQLLEGDQITSMSFRGDDVAVATRAMDGRRESAARLRTGDPALYSGADDDRDEAIVRQSPSAGSGRAHVRCALERGRRLGLRVRPGLDRQRCELPEPHLHRHDDRPRTRALATAKENVPGFTGFSGALMPQTCSLSAYAGQTVLLAFRASTTRRRSARAVGPAGLLGRRRQGRWARSPTAPASPAGSRSPRRRANTVAGFTIWIVSIDTARERAAITVRPLPLNVDFSVNGKAKIEKFVDPKGRIRRRDRLLRRHVGD